jgi:hypothetical protein
MPANPSRTVRLRLHGKLRGDGIVRGGSREDRYVSSPERIGSILLRQEVTMTRKEYDERRRALEEEGAVAVKEYSEGGVHTVYRRLRGAARK